MTISRPVIIAGSAFLFLLLLIGSMIIFGREKRPSPSPEAESHEEAWLPPTEEERETVRSLRNGPLRNIERDIPENAGYEISYDDSGKDPVFRITLNASNWKEFYALQDLAFAEFRTRGVDPCSLPLWNAIATGARDWRSFDSSPPGEGIPVPCAE